VATERIRRHIDEINTVIQTGRVEMRPRLYNADVKGRPDYAWTYLVQVLVYQDVVTGDFVRGQNEWKLVFHGLMAHDAIAHLRGGERILVHGKQRTRRWVDSETKAENYEAEIRVASFEIILLPSRTSDGMAGMRPGASWANPEAYSPSVEETPKWQPGSAKGREPRERRRRRPPPGASRKTTSDDS
jgi:single-stranded DNA-binding protein